MISSEANLQATVSNFRTDGMMRYSQFVPKLYNLCRYPCGINLRDGKVDSGTLEWQEIIDMLNQQSADNPDQIDLEEAVQTMEQLQEVRIAL